MNWIELSVQTDAEGAEAAAALLNEMVETGAAIEQTIIPEVGEKFDPARAFTVRAFFSSDQREQFHLARSQRDVAATKNAEAGLHRTDAD